MTIHDFVNNSKNGRMGKDYRMNTIKMRLELKGNPLIKFQDEEKITSLQRGTVYMKSLEYYRRKEAETGDATVGDLFEGMLHVNDGYAIIPEMGICERLSDSLLQTTFSNNFVFCMFSTLPDIKSFQYSEEQKEKMSSFGDTALIITNRDEFIRRLSIAVLHDKLTGSHGFVRYADEKVDSAAYWTSLFKNGMSYSAFWKRKRYAYQQEYRFLIEPPTVKTDYYKLNIGNIEDISYSFSIRSPKRISNTTC